MTGQMINLRVTDKSRYFVACVTSVSVAFLERFFSFGRAKSGARTKKQKEGVGEVEKEKLADKPSDFGNLRSSAAKGALDWCGLDRII